MTAMTVFAIIKGIKAKAMPIVKGYACHTCGSIAILTMKDNTIKVKKCACVKGAK